MDARARNRRGTILQLVAGQDAIGQPSPVWEPLATVMANVRYLSGVEAIKAGAETALAKASVRIAYRTNVTTGMRFQLGATVFEIKVVLPDETGKRHTDLAVEAIE
jgi:SPP1 family predicted phage head-tail adaptor